MKTYKLEIERGGFKELLPCFNESDVTRRINSIVENGASPRQMFVNVTTDLEDGITHTVRYPYRNWMALQDNPALPPMIKKVPAFAANKPLPSSFLLNNNGVVHEYHG